MTEQIQMEALREDPDEVVERAKAEHSPILTVALFSGGDDSLVTAHRCREHYEKLVWLDTGLALPGVEDFVREAAEWIGKPLTILRQRPDEDRYRTLVLGDPANDRPPLGFPGPFQHGRVFNELKQILLERHLRETKVGHPRTARVLHLTGIRREESARRAKKPAINRKNSIVYANPIIDWTRGDLNRYKREHDAPQSEVAALLHRSGECNCLAYSTEGEREMIRDLWPEWFAEKIAPLEEEAERLGLTACRWGGGHFTPEELADLAGGATLPEAGELCSSCEFGQQLAIEAALGKPAGAG